MIDGLEVGAKYSVDLLPRTYSFGDTVFITLEDPDLKIFDESLTEVTLFGTTYNIVISGGEPPPQEDATPSEQPAGKEINLFGQKLYIVVGGFENNSTGLYTLAIQETEPPPAPAIRTVTNIGDEDDGVCDGDCSLREAINSTEPGDTIEFDIPGDGPHTIELDGPLIFQSLPQGGGQGFEIKISLPGVPSDTDINAVINGFSEPGSSPNTNPADVPSNAVRNIILKAASPGNLPSVSLTSGWSLLKRGIEIQDVIDIHDPGITILEGMFFKGNGIKGTAKANLMVMNSEFENANVNVAVTAAAGEKSSLASPGISGWTATLIFRPPVRVALTWTCWTMHLPSEIAPPAAW